MSEMMTATELAEARELASKSTAGPWLPLLNSRGMTGVHASECKIYHVELDPVCIPETHARQKADARFIAAARTLVPRLLATVDALTERAERYFNEAAQADLDFLSYADAAGIPRENPIGAKDLVSSIKALRERTEQAERKLEILSLSESAEDLLTQLIDAQDEASEAIASKKQAEAERDRQKRDADRLGAEVHVLKSERDTYAEQLAGALAMLAETRRAMEEAGNLVLQAFPIIGENTATALPASWIGKAADRLKEALNLHAPEALRQQQEREAEKDALIEALRGAIQGIREEVEDLQGGCNHCGSYEGHIEGCFMFYACEVLNITPPQALAKQREYVGAPERAIERLRAIASDELTCGATEDEGSICFRDAIDGILAEFDAVKGGR